MRTEAILVLVFTFFKNILYLFCGRFRFSFCSKTCYLRKYAGVECKVYGDVWVHVYAFWVHVYGSVGCMCAVVEGCKYAETFGCMYAEVGCKFHTAEGLPDSR